MTDEGAVLYLDTNILLHYRPLREIDWKAVVNEKLVRLILCSPVLDELDEKKWNPRTADRARRAMCQIKQSREAGGKVRDGVTLDVILDDGGKTDCSNQDTEIIRMAEIHKVQHPAQRVTVVTGDYNMGLRCSAKGVDCIEMPDEWLQPLADTNTRKIRQLEQENRKLKNRQPDFKLVPKIITDEINPPSADYPVELTRLAGAPVDVAAKMHEVRQKYPKLRCFRTPITRGGIAQDALGLYKATSQEMDRYNRDLDNFFLQYEAACNGKNREMEAVARSFYFELWLENNGGTPGTAVEICVGFPDELVEIQDANERLTHAPPFPDPPVEPRTYAQTLKSSLTPDRTDYDRRMMEIAQDLGPAPNVSKPMIGLADDGEELHLTVRRIKHHHPLCLGCYVVTYPSWDAIRPLEVRYRIHANELLEPQTGRLFFNVSEAESLEKM